MVLERVHISHDISKLGKDIPTVSLPAIVTCREGCVCRKGCYACKGRFLFPSVKKSLANNLAAWQAAPEVFESDVIYEASLVSHWRWHSSGDIPDLPYLEMMVRAALRRPDTRFLAFSKKYELVNGYLDEHAPFPKNLKVFLSAWGSFIPPNPHNLPMAYVRLKGVDCFIPEDAMECQGYCGECADTGHSCWDLENGQSVVFNQH